MKIKGSNFVRFDLQDFSVMSLSLLREKYSRLCLKVTETGSILIDLFSPISIKPHTRHLPPTLHPPPFFLSSIDTGLNAFFAVSQMVYNQVCACVYEREIAILNRLSFSEYLQTKGPVFGRKPNNRRLLICTHTQGTIASKIVDDYVPAITEGL